MSAPTVMPSFCSLRIIGVSYNEGSGCIFLVLTLSGARLFLFACSDSSRSVSFDYCEIRCWRFAASNADTVSSDICFLIVLLEF